MRSHLLLHRVADALIPAIPVLGGQLSGRVRVPTLLEAFAVLREPLQIPIMLLRICCAMLHAKRGWGSGRS